MKDLKAEIIVKLVRNFQLIFPVLFEDIDPNIIRQKILKNYDESIAREDIV